MIPLPLVDDALFIDNSSLERFITCPRSAEYYICHRRESSEERISLAFGKAIHKILEVRYRTGTTVTPTVEQSMFATAGEAFKDWPFTDPDEYRNYSTAVGFIKAYNTEYPMEGFETVRLPDGGPAIEVPFAVPLGELEINAPLSVRLLDGQITQRVFQGLKIIWTGRIDLVYEREGGLYLMDHKTSSIMGPQYFKEFDLSSQVFGYAWALSRLLKRQVTGFTANVIAIRKPTKTGKALEFKRYIVPIDADQCAEWEYNTLQIISDFVEMARRSYMPMHTKWCVNKYGLCPYTAICSLPIKQREIMLLSPNYKEVNWSPLHNSQ